MNILPSSERGWWRLRMLMFQVYIPAAFVVELIYQHSIVHRRHGEPSFHLTTLVGYVLACAVLAAGGVVQRRIGDLEGGTISWLLAAAGVVFGALIPSPFAL